MATNYTENISQINSILRQLRIELAELENFTQLLGSPGRDHTAFQTAIAAEERIKIGEAARQIQLLLPGGSTDEDKVLNQIEKLLPTKKIGVTFLPNLLGKP